MKQLIDIAVAELASDINECEENTDDCAINAVCTNTIGSFECACRQGYRGNGKNCTGKYTYFLFWYCRCAYILCEQVQLNPIY